MCVVCGWRVCVGVTTGGVCVWVWLLVANRCTYLTVFRKAFTMSQSAAFSGMWTHGVC